MSARPVAESLFSTFFDDDKKVRAESRALIDAQLRCRKGHRIAFTVETEYGPWAAWRCPWVRPHPITGTWEYGWVDESGDQQAQCSECQWVGHFPVAWLAEQHRTVDVDDIPDIGPVL